MPAGVKASCSIYRKTLALFQCPIENSDFTYGVFDQGTQNTIFSSTTLLRHFNRLGGGPTVTAFTPASPTLSLLPFWTYVMTICERPGTKLGGTAGLDIAA